MTSKQHKEFLANCRTIGAMTATMTIDAYSFDAYGEEEWKAAAIMLCERGHSASIVEEILRSKLTRWSRDHAGKHEGTAADLAAFLDHKHGQSSLKGLLNEIKARKD